MTTNTLENGVKDSVGQVIERHSAHYSDPRMARAYLDRIAATLSRANVPQHSTLAQVNVLGYIGRAYGPKGLEVLDIFNKAYADGLNHALDLKTNVRRIVAINEAYGNVPDLPTLKKMVSADFSWVPHSRDARRSLPRT